MRWATIGCLGPPCITAVELDEWVKAKQSQRPDYRSSSKDPAP